MTPERDETVRAVAFERFGGPDVLRIMDLPAPHARADQVRVRVAAAAVNPTDLVFRSGAHADRVRSLPPPWVPGMDCAGTIIEASEGGDDWPTGARVMAAVAPARPEGGAQAEAVVVPRASLVPVPEGMTLEEAATIPMNALTAMLALARLALPRGATLGVTGAAGMLGGMVVQLAAHRGLQVIADASDDDRAIVEGLGAHVVVPRGPDVAAAMRTHAADGVDGLVDAAVMAEQAFPAVRDDGHVAAVRRHEGRLPRGITLHQIGVLTELENAVFIAELGELVGDGVLRPRLASRHDASEVADVHQRMARGGVRGRMVLTF